MTDLRQLRHFVAVAEALNFRVAAERLHMAQPPLSTSIRKLEEHLGSALFERSRRGTALTPAGLAALGDARRVLADARQFEATARDVARGLAGTLSIGYVASSTYEVLPRVLPAFQRSHPGVRLQLLEHSSSGVLDMVEDGRADLGLMRTPLSGATRVCLEPFQRESLIVALPDTARWRRRRKVRLAELAQEPFVLYSLPFARSLTMLACQQAGFIPDVAQEASGLPTVVSLVKCGLGMALVPEVAQRWPVEGVLFRPLSDIDPNLGMGLALAWQPPPRSPLVQRFREALAHAYPNPSAIRSPPATRPQR
ncbi:MAG: LysR family transcriptional regulator [Lautropia sp.]